MTYGNLMLEIKVLVATLEIFNHKVPFMELQVLNQRRDRSAANLQKL